MKSPRHAAFTWVEALVALSLICVVLGIALALALPSIIPCSTRGQMTQILSNQRQLHLATQQMALDGETTGNTNLGWPGDTGSTFRVWATNLVPAYLSTNDLAKLLSGPGKIVNPGKLPTAMSDSAILIYAVSSNSPPETVFLTTANFTNTPGVSPPLNPAAKPYGDKGFVIFHKGGDGAILLPKQVTNTNLIGTFVPLLR